MNRFREIAMTPAENILDITAKMDTAALVRFLIAEKFPGRTAVTCSLRGRSIVAMKLIADVDPATPIVFCHMPNVYPESQEYKLRIIGKLGLLDVREPVPDGGPHAGDCNHSEALWAENPVDNSRVYETVQLNAALADADCWISAVYHGPYPTTPGSRIRAEGRMIRVDPLADWTQEQVRQFMKEHRLPYHPQAMMRRPKPAKEESKTVAGYHF